MSCKQSKADPSLYVLRTEGETIYILVRVCDILMLAKNMEVRRRVAETITRKVEVCIGRKVAKFLEIVIELDPMRRTVKLTFAP